MVNYGYEKIKTLALYLGSAFTPFVPGDFQKYAAKRLNFKSEFDDWLEKRKEFDYKCSKNILDLSNAENLDWDKRLEKFNKESGNSHDLTFLSGFFRGGRFGYSVPGVHFFGRPL